MPDPATSHTAHDELLIAAYAAGDASGRELELAAGLLAACPECARLHRDLRALASALASSPAPARPRDFGITAAQAAELRAPRGWRRLLAPLAGARSATGPIATSLAALGLAGLLLGGGLRGLPLGGAGTTALAPVPAASLQNVGAPLSNGFDTNATGGGEAAGPSAAAASTAPQVAGVAPSAAASMAAAPSAAPAASAPAASEASNGGPSAAAPSTAAIGSPKSVAHPSPALSSGPTARVATPDSSAAAALAPTPPEDTQVPGSATASSSGEGSGPSALVLGSAALLVAGLALGFLRLAARRLVP